MFIFALFSFWNNVFSYDLDFSWKWFYSNIYENNWDLKWKMYKIELKDNWWTNKKIAEISWVSCLSNELSQNDMKEVAEKWNLASIKNSFTCKKWNEIDQNAFKKVVQAVQDLHLQTISTSESKSEKLLQFSNIWVYNDGIEWNAPFDLIKDFEDIDKIIFSQYKEKIEYKPWDDVNLKGKVSSALWEVNKNSPANNSQNWNSQNWNNSSSSIFSNENNFQNNENFTVCSLDWNCENYSEVQKLLCEINWNCNEEEKHWFLTLKNDFVCKADDSWLNNVTWKIISANLSWNIKNPDKKTEKNWENNSWTSNSWKNNSQNNAKNSSWWNNQSNSKLQTPSSAYKKLDDNKKFPCDDIFCIDIQFKIHDFSLSYANEDPPIQYLINRSNDHLKKFINSSLSQAKMSINNFELNLKDIKLPDMFHMWVQISQEPVPLFQVEKDDKFWVDEWDTKLETQLKKYYELHWLDYKMPNDLSAFVKTEANAQATLNSSTSQTTNLWPKLQDFKDLSIEKLWELNRTQKLIEEKARFSRIDNFEEQLKEVERFNAWINTYIINLETILKEIKKIPVDTSTT